MPIKGLTDKDTIHNGSQLPLVARLYKGTTKKPNAPGTDLDYFRVEFEEEYQELAPIFHELYAEEPSEFESIRFMGNTVDEVFPTWMEEWKHSSDTLLRRCDGEHQVQHWNADAEVYMKSKIPCLGDGCKCVRYGRLTFILPDFTDVTGVFGAFKISVTSTHDILTLHSRLRLLEQQFGSLQMMDFRFGRATRKISRPNGEGGRIKMKRSLLFIELAPEYARNVVLPRLRQQTQALPEPTRQLDLHQGRTLLGSGGERRIDTNTGEIVEPEVEIIEVEAVDDEPDYYSYITRIEVTLHEGRKWLKCYTTTDSILGIRSREMFIKAGWLTKDNLTAEGDSLDFDPPIPVLTEKIDDWNQITEIKRMIDTMLPEAVNS